ncbi:MAG: nucleoside 2-deoxyribosyltransferase [Patescibacteria group bacterium]
MKIFFIGSIRGGRANQPHYVSIVSALEKFGTVSPQHVSDEALSEFGETRLTGTEILERELAALATCDVVVAEVTTPSLGVGYLIGRATILNKKVIALHNGGDTSLLSGIIKGDSGVEIHTYKTDTDIDNILQEIFI